MFYLFLGSGVLLGVLLCAYLFSLFLRILKELSSGAEPKNSLWPFSATTSGNLKPPVLNSNGVSEIQAAMPLQTQSAPQVATPAVSASSVDTPIVSAQVVPAAADNKEEMPLIPSSSVPVGNESAKISTTTEDTAKLLLVEKNAVANALELLAINDVQVAAVEDFYTLKAGENRLRIKYCSKNQQANYSLLEIKVALEANNSYRLIFDGNDDSFKLERCAL